MEKGNVRVPERNVNNMKSHRLAIPGMHSGELTAVSMCSRSLLRQMALCHRVGATEMDNGRETVSN